MSAYVEDAVRVMWEERNKLNSRCAALRKVFKKNKACVIAFLKGESRVASSGKVGKTNDSGTLEL